MLEVLGRNDTFSFKHRTKYHIVVLQFLQNHNFHNDHCYDDDDVDELKTE